MRRTSSKPRDMKTFECPQCGKKRMVRPMDHEVSLDKREYTTVRGSKIELHHDVCDFCHQKNYRKFFEPSRDDMRRLLNAIHDQAGVEEEESLEDLL